MNAFVRLEAFCARLVERTFAVAFPSALQPVMIARKLVSAFEGAGAGPRDGRRFLVQLSPADAARFSADRAYLERQWAAMLSRLGERSGTPRRPAEVAIVPSPQVATGTVAIALETLPPPVRLALRLRRGMPLGAHRILEGEFVVGRDDACGLVLLDPRVSRRHVHIEASGAQASFRDLGSSNGTFLNGEKRENGQLSAGDVLGLGDCELIVDDHSESPL